MREQSLCVSLLTGCNRLRAKWLLPLCIGSSDGDAGKTHTAPCSPAIFLDATHHPLHVYGDGFCSETCGCSHLWLIKQCAILSILLFLKVFWWSVLLLITVNSKVQFMSIVRAWIFQTCIYTFLVCNRESVCLRPVWGDFVSPKLLAPVLLLQWKGEMLPGTGYSGCLHRKLQVCDSSPAPKSVWKGQLILEVIKFKIISSPKMLNTWQTGKVTDEGEKNISCFLTVLLWSSKDVNEAVCRVS